jgi:hypothetical protein
MEMFVVEDTDSENEVVSEAETVSETVSEATPESPQVTTRSGRVIKKTLTLIEASIRYRMVYFLCL